MTAPLLPLTSPTPYPTSTAYPTDTPELARGSSRHNPLGLGETAIVQRDSWLDGASTIELELLELVSGDEAWNRVNQANMFNDAPREGQEYILALFRVKVLETEREPLAITHALFDAVSADGKVYGEFISVAGLEPSLRTERYEGAEHSGWTYFLVDEEDTPVAAFDRGADSETWFALRP